MHSDLRIVRSFVAVATERSFTRAAEKLRLTQPTLSLQIQRLEDYVGFALFSRTTRRVHLTAEGYELFELSRRLVEDFEKIRIEVRRLRDRTRSELHVGTAFFTIDIPERNNLLDAFTTHSPQTKVVVHDAAQTDLIAAVGRGRLDCAIVLGVGTPETDFYSPKRTYAGDGLYPVEWCRVTIGTKRIGLLIPRELPLADAAVILPAMLTGQKVAVIDPDQGVLLLEPLHDMLKTAGAEIVFSFESRHALAVVRFGTRRRIPCVSLGWFQGPDGLTAGNMVWRPIEAFDRTTDLVLICRSGQERAITDTFIKFASAWCDSCRVAEQDNRDTSPADSTNASLFHNARRRSHESPHFLKDSCWPYFAAKS